MYKGYCYFEDGTHTDAVTLNTAEEAVNYARLQGRLFKEVMIVDEDDYIVMHIIDGQIVFPTAEMVAENRKGENE